MNAGEVEQGFDERQPFEAAISVRDSKKQRRSLIETGAQGEEEIRRVGDVLQHLRGDDEIEALLRRERRRREKADVARADMLASPGERVRVFVDRGDLDRGEPRGQRCRELGPGAAADIENAPRRARLDGSADEVQPFGAPIGILRQRHTIPTTARN